MVTMRSSVRICLTVKSVANRLSVGHSFMSASNATHIGLAGAGFAPPPAGGAAVKHEGVPVWSCALQNKGLSVIGTCAATQARVRLPAPSPIHQLGEKYDLAS